MIVLCRTSNPQWAVVSCQTFSHHSRRTSFHSEMLKIKCVTQWLISWHFKRKGDINFGSTYIDTRYTNLDAIADGATEMAFYFSRNILRLSNSKKIKTRWNPRLFPRWVGKYSEYNKQHMKFVQFQSQSPSFFVKIRQWIRLGKCEVSLYVDKC